MMTRPTPQQVNRAIFWEKTAYLFTGVVLVLVVLMRYISFDISWDVSFLPLAHAIVNSLTAVALILGFIFIKRGSVTAHKVAMISALILSAIFLLSYVMYHISTEPTSYGGTGASAVIYYALLLTHIVLAALSLPFILITFIRGYFGLYQKHRKMARWVFPIWLYVAITGPVCYLMLAPYY